MHNNYKIFTYKSMLRLPPFDTPAFKGQQTVSKEIKKDKDNTQQMSMPMPIMLDNYVAYACLHNIRQGTPTTSVPILRIRPLAVASFKAIRKVHTSSTRCTLKSPNMATKARKIACNVRCRYVTTAWKCIDIVYINVYLCAYTEKNN